MSARPSPSPSPSGEAPAFDDVYREHVAFVWRSLRRLGLADADTEDAAHEVFMIVHRRLSEFEPQRSLQGWLFGIARGVARNRRRSLRRRQDHLQRLPPHDDAALPDDVLEGQRAAACVRAFLGTLDPASRLVFELSEIEGLRGPEIAEVLEMNVNTVSTRLRRARIAFAAFAARHHTPSKSCG